MPSLAIDFCSLSELKKKKKITKWVEEWRDELSAIFLDDKVWVISSICPHFGGEFELIPHKKIVRCRWHGWCFDIKSGKCQTGVMSTHLKHYPFEEKNGLIRVFLHDHH